MIRDENNLNQSSMEFESTQADEALGRSFGLRTIPQLRVLREHGRGLQESVRICSIFSQLGVQGCLWLTITGVDNERSIGECLLKTTVIFSQSRVL